jgi:hypothetical protein
MSRKLDQQSAEANALRTLDERRQAQAARDGRDAARPAPGYGQPAGGQPAGYGSGAAYVPAPAQAPAQAPIIVRQDSGLGHVVVGAMIARSAANAHANNNNSGGYYPAPGGGGGDLATKVGADAVDTAAGGKAGGGSAAGGSVLGAIGRTILWLLVLALIGWVAYTAWKRVKRRREANKPNYSFERN